MIGMEHEVELHRVADPVARVQAAVAHDRILPPSSGAASRGFVPLGERS